LVFLFMCSEDAESIEISTVGNYLGIASGSHA